MSGSVNKVILIGNLGKDPDVRHLENGATVANFPIATSENYKDRKTGEKVSQTEWHNIVVWRGLADITERYLKKGDKVYIEGKLRTRSWQDQDGNTKYTTEVVADNLTMLGKSPDNSTSPPSQPAAASSSTTQNEDFSGPDDSDDLPF